MTGGDVLICSRCSLISGIEEDSEGKKGGGRTVRGQLVVRGLREQW